MQELEERRNQAQNDDNKVELVDVLKGDMEKLQKKYDMTRRLCNLRNDDITTLRQEVHQLKEQISHMQLVSQMKESDFAKLSQKYQTVKSLCEMRKEKLNSLRARLEESSNAEELT